MIKKIFFFFIDTLQAIVFVASIFILFYLFIAQPNQVNGRSMEPNFADKELLLTDKISYHLRQPRRGEVVVFRAPPSEPCAEDECEYIKRIIGLPGETIMVSSGQVFINGLPLNESYLPASLSIDPGSFLSQGKQYIIPSDYYILMGDNRPHSRDSREFGPIKKEAIVGKAFFVYWPPKAAGLVPAPRLAR